MRKRMVRVLILGVAGFLSMAAQCGPGGGGGGDDGGGGGNMTCTPSNSVSVQTGFGSSNGRCTQLSSSFNVNNEMWGCSSWTCMAPGDVIKFEWRRPNNTIRDTDTDTVSAGKPTAWLEAFNTFPDVTGQWSLKVFRNGTLVASLAFSVF